MDDRPPLTPAAHVHFLKWIRAAANDYISIIIERVQLLPEEALNWRPDNCKESAMDVLDRCKIALLTWPFNREDPEETLHQGSWVEAGLSLKQQATQCFDLLDGLTSHEVASLIDASNTLKTPLYDAYFWPVRTLIHALGAIEGLLHRYGIRQDLWFQGSASMAFHGLDVRDFFDEAIEAELPRLISRRSEQDRVGAQAFVMDEFSLSAFQLEQSAYEIINHSLYSGQDPQGEDNLVQPERHHIAAKWESYGDRMSRAAAKWKEAMHRVPVSELEVEVELYRPGYYWPVRSICWRPVWSVIFNEAFWKYRID